MMLAGTRVLIVEDDALISMMVEDYLDELGCILVGVASRLEDGLEKADSLCIDLAVLDVNLAGRLSYPIADRLKARNIPFVFATGYGTEGLPEQLKGTPVLAKPFKAEQLGAMIQAVRRG